MPTKGQPSSGTDRPHLLRTFALFPTVNTRPDPNGDEIRDSSATGVLPAPEVPAADQHTSLSGLRKREKWGSTHCDGGGPCRSAKSRPDRGEPQLTFLWPHPFLHMYFTLAWETGISHRALLQLMEGVWGRGFSYPERQCLHRGLKEWLERFHGVAPKYLQNYLG